jgi:hypothetical protein
MAWAFYDVGNISYAKLKNIVDTEKPYRNTSNKYNLGSRRYSNRYFLWIDEVAHVYYHNLKLGMIRSDNTFELDVMRGPNVAGWLGQGECQLLSALLRKYVNSQSRKGGVVIYNGQTFHPAFRGLRFYIDSLKLHESCYYDVLLPRVDRTKANELRKEYQQLFTLGAAMFRASGGDVILRDMQEAMKESRVDKLVVDNIVNPKSPTALVDHNNPYDTVLNMALFLNVNQCRHRSLYPTSYGQTIVERLFGEDINNFVKQTQKEFMKAIYLDRKPFNYEVVKGGERYPSNSWEVRVVFNGVDTPIMV